MKAILLLCSSILLAIPIGCGSDSSTNTNQNPKVAETETLLTAHSWHGVWYSATPSVQSIGLLGENFTFNPDKSSEITSCDTPVPHSWSVTDSTVGTLLYISYFPYVIQKLTADTLLLRDISSNQLTYLFVKNPKVYNRIKMYKTFDNGQTAGIFGLPCADFENTEILEYNFKCYNPSPNPTIEYTRIGVAVGTDNTSVKITLDGGQSELAVIADTVLPAGNHGFPVDLRKINVGGGVYRLSYTVKPEDVSIPKTIYSYFLSLK